MTDRRDQLATRCRELGAECQRDGMPMYARLCEYAAADSFVLALLDRARPGQARPVLLLAAAQRVLFDHPSHPLAQYYPSVSGSPVASGDPGPTFAAFLREHAGAVGELIATRATQTNEVNRSVAVAAVLREATVDLPSAPIALVELGPSAGLNLRADTYAIELAGRGLHQATGSEVRLVCQLVGGGVPGLDRPLPPVVDRVGLDLHPIDVRTDRDDLRWLEACLWPEQTERLVRFRAAVAAARRDPPRLVQGDLLDDLPALLDALPAGAHAFVFHSWVLTYVARERRPALLDALAAAAQHRAVSWFSAEAPTVVPGLAAPEIPDDGTTVLGLTTWREGATRTRVLGTCHPHLRWLAWQS